MFSLLECSQIKFHSGYVSSQMTPNALQSDSVALHGSVAQKVVSGKQICFGTYVATSNGEAFRRRQVLMLHAH